MHGVKGVNMNVIGKVAACALALAAGSAAAQEGAAGLRVELNAAEAGERTCKLSFLIENGHPSDIGQAVFETVIFDAAGQVDRLTLFDFGALPAGRPRVRQFVIQDTTCDDIGQLLFNGADTCEAEGLGPQACTKGLTLESRAGIEVTG